MDRGAWRATVYGVTTEQSGMHSLLEQKHISHFCYVDFGLITGIIFILESWKKEKVLYLAPAFLVTEKNEQRSIHAMAAKAS